jgi:hypothetical protein
MRSKVSQFFSKKITTLAAHNPIKGEPLAVAIEEDVFRTLGLEYKLPKDRDV